ncbi:DUF1549 domain-containing protein [Lignipirellula cremea]|uniref:DUF1549 domain-containing protein n=1 Tax=Lignipirellula cremea TaxID=2528010 RepID=A0A518DQR0_9BACT|nr:DUF1549 domain-containing protein [Lignipirellula cremea]QDU94175.1 hypothetical protein Pla8534_19630 [Lignipirellula cremea]
MTCSLSGRFCNGLVWFAAITLTGLVAGDSLRAQEQAALPPANSYNLEQVAEINARIRATWGEYQLQPSAPATDGEWCRRVYLDVLGRIPSYVELKAFIADTNPNKKERLVDSLLHDEQFTEEYARNWTTLWTNILIGRNGGNERRSLTDRAGMQKYLRDSFARNKPYDRMVYELVTAKGSNKPGHENFNGAVNFLTMKLEENATQATADTTKIFLGLQVQCTQCHNHPFNEWKQKKFWEINAFFRQTRPLRRYLEGTRELDYVELTNEDYPGESGNPADAEIFYELRNGFLEVAYPVFLDGSELNHSGFVEDVDRRTELGKLMMSSEFLDKMIANRMWSHFLGYGFTKPIDDLGPHNPPSHPDLLNYLGQEVRKADFDLKELIKWITLSEAYSLSSVLNESNTMDDPMLGETPKFSHFYMRQMRAEELYESLLIATQAHKTRGAYEEQESQKNEWLKQFVVAFGTDEGDESTTFNGTIPQALMMFNGDLIKKATNMEDGSFLQQVADNDRASAAQKIDYLFMAALARQPSKAEVGMANRLLRSRMDQARATQDRAAYEKAPVASLQDMWWVLLNSNEFILIH